MNHLLIARCLGGNACTNDGNGGPQFVRGGSHETGLQRLVLYDRPKQLSGKKTSNKTKSGWPKQQTVQKEDAGFESGDLEEDGRRAEVKIIGTRRVLPKEDKLHKRHRRYHCCLSKSIL